MSLAIGRHASLQKYSTVASYVSRCLWCMLAGMYGYVKMTDGERICNLSVSVVQNGHQLVEVGYYDTDNEHLKIDHIKLESIIWSGNTDRMPASDTVQFKRMHSTYIHNSIIKGLTNAA